MKILAGYELGIGPFAAMRGINIIDGQLAPNAAITGSLIKRDPDYNYIVKTSTREECEIQFLCCGEVVGTNRWEMTDAELAGVANKYNWKKYPRAMLFARTLTEGARQHCPHIFAGSVYVPEELGAEGEVIDVDVVQENKLVSGEMELMEADAAIAYAEEVVAETGKFPPSDYLAFGEKLGYADTALVDMKNECDGDFACAVVKLIEKYKEING